MKVYAEPQLDDFCIKRISGALKKYAPSHIEFVGAENEAELIIYFVHGFRKSIWWKITSHLNAGRKCAIVQLSLKLTANPQTSDWIEVWQLAHLVWSYYDLPRLCRQEGTDTNFPFYHAPLGVDCSVFVETLLPRIYGIGIHAKGWSRESLREVVTAARSVGKTVLNFETPKDFGPGIEYTGIIRDDSLMARFYSQCEYVSGLRRVEGFELPVIEGLLCGARPICYDLPDYRTWYEGLVEFVSEEGGREKITPRISQILTQPPRPVSIAEKQLVCEKFNWQAIVDGFWNRL